MPCWYRFIRSWADRRTGEESLYHALLQIQLTMTRAGGNRDDLVLKKLEAKVDWDKRQRAFQGHLHVVGVSAEILRTGS